MRRIEILLDIVGNLIEIALLLTIPLLVLLSFGVGFDAIWGTSFFMGVGALLGVLVSFTAVVIRLRQG